VLERRITGPCGRAVRAGGIDRYPDDDKFAARLGSVNWGHRLTGRIKIESKGMRKRGLPSLDRADAAAVAVAFSDRANAAPPVLDLDGASSYEPSTAVAQTGRPLLSVFSDWVLNLVRKALSWPLADSMMVPPSCQIPSRCWNWPGGSPWFMWMSCTPRPVL
jgi:hypothetical protein